MALTSKTAGALLVAVLFLSACGTGSSLVRTAAGAAVNTTTAAAGAAAGVVMQDACHAMSDC